MAVRQARLFRGWLTVSRAGGEPHSATATQRTTSGVGVGQHDTRRSSQRLRRCGWRAYPAAISREQIHSPRLTNQRQRNTHTSGQTLGSTQQDTTRQTQSQAGDLEQAGRGSGLKHLSEEAEPIRLRWKTWRRRLKRCRQKGNLRC